MSTNSDNRSCGEAWDIGLAGRSAVVVGTGPAIGRACVEGLARVGAQVACLDRDASAAHDSAAAARALGVESSAHTVDVLDRESVHDTFAQIARQRGGIDILVNVVGSSRWSPTADASDDDWDTVFALNLRQQWVVAQEALHLMIPARQGSIVAISSVSALASSTLHGAYGAAKAGVNSLVRTLAIENGQYGVRVNAIAPGTIDTPARAGDTALAAKVPLQRRGRPSDIGGAAVFLASAAASYITGQVLVVDGGVSATHALIDMSSDDQNHSE
ncbi:SDR family NAD(P)-dependent oxidoreductase [Gordonia sp. ABSL11-1]|uniref:SDR family NAD(P)-dependent oxidoreductase n=1 Tax=Gordonia sp. ABSL11-1 TaxID=3053924 RepID=UPI0025745329|nr:SDR family NAD(P)-dependent oxidoreductase [Gordonia sp. ABSL11-1]MDL9948616.1 SDR family NAD(P)-dependent oxidoreductase [Gordonia sp. ABSL11-1]